VAALFHTALQLNQVVIEPLTVSYASEGN